MRRLWFRWALLILSVAVLGTAFVNLGDWQLDRLQQRQVRNADTVRNSEAPVRPYAEVFDHTLTDADQWQRVSATGTFDAEHQYLLRYRKNAGTDGYEVVTPLRTSQGTVLVDRGFISVARGVQIPDVAPAPPSGEVTVVGHTRRNEKGRRAALTPVDRVMRQISSEAIAPTLPYPVVDGYIGLLTVDPPQVGGFTTIELPEISDGPHFWYAVQWFMFTGIGVLGIIVFIRGDLRVRREQRAKEAAGDPAPVGVD